MNVGRLVTSGFRENIFDFQIIVSDETMTVATLKKRLEDQYGDKIKIGTRERGSTFIHFEDDEYAQLKKKWDGKKLNSEQEAESSIKATAAVIRNEIINAEYETGYYSSSDVMFSEKKMIDDIPSLLFTLIHSIICKNKKGDPQALIRKSIVICHLIIAATRPRSFLSSILVGLSVLIYRKFASKSLIDLCSNLGITSSYNEARLYLQSHIVNSVRKFIKNVWVHFGFDNADFPKP